MRKKLFSTILFVAMCLTISSPVLAASHADDVIQRNPNRYYYVYEYEVVMEARETTDAYLVTGNIKHFPVKPYVVTPKEMLEILNENER